MSRFLIQVVTVVAALLLSSCDDDYHRTVDAPVDKVAAALLDVDLRQAPGAPGTDPMRSGDVPSMFAAAREGDKVVWTVTNGGEVAVRLIANLTPADGGKTDVTLDYERGPAPDDHVAPAFRSRGVTMGLLAMMVEERLDRVTMPPTKWTSKCDDITARFEAEGPDALAAGEPTTLREAFGRTAQTSMRLAALDKELKRAGCPTGFEGGFKPVRSELGDSPTPPQPTGGVSYEPGKPMIDVSGR